MHELVVTYFFLWIHFSFSNYNNYFLCLSKNSWLFNFHQLILVGYCATKSDINRLTKGYDDCGNICGKKNKDLNIKGCTVILKKKIINVKLTLNLFQYEDMTTKPKLELDKKFSIDGSDIVHYTCVEKCKLDYEEVFNRCIKVNGTDSYSEEQLKAQKSFFSALSEDLIRTWHKILLVCFISFILSYSVLMLFRYAVKYVIWIIYGGFVALFIVAAIAFWIVAAIKFSKTKDASMMVPAGFLTLIALVAIIILMYFRKRIRLVAKLFKETSKALVDIPTILLEPILTFLSLILAFVPFILFMIVIQTTGDPVDIKNQDKSIHVSFESGAGAILAYILNFIAFVWFTQFIIGCQHFIIAGK